MELCADVRCDGLRPKNALEADERVRCQGPGYRKEER